MNTPQVWIGCLAAYNDGKLHGEWVDATDEDELIEARDRILKASPVPLAEEAFIADYDSFGALATELGEYPSYETVARIGSLIEDHGEEFIAFVDCIEPDIETVDEDDFYTHRRGEHDSEEAFAEQYIADVGWGGLEAIPDELFPYLDMEMITTELFQHGEYISRPSANFNVYVFEQNV